jgi:hypothetical protein
MYFWKFIQILFEEEEGGKRSREGGGGEGE